MKCLNCEHELNRHDTFCPNCGVDCVAQTEAKGLCDGCTESFPAAALKNTPAGRLCRACVARQDAAHKAEEERARLQKERYKASERAAINNQRKHPRFTVAKSWVRLSRQGLAGKLLGKPREAVAPILDLSRSGLQCDSPEEYKRGDKVSLQIMIPAFSSPLEVMAVVCRVRPLSGEATPAFAEGVDPTESAIMRAIGPRFSIGVRFESTDENVRRHLEALETHRALREAALLQDEKQQAGKKRSSAENRQIRDF